MVVGAMTTTSDGRTLPGACAPYLMRDGEGERYLVGSHLATVIARPDDTAARLECVVWSGGKGASMPMHQHQHGHEAVLVLDGRVELSIGTRRSVLSRGDYASLPPGTPHGHRLLAHGTKVVTWTVGGGAYQLCKEAGEPFAGVAYPPDAPPDVLPATLAALPPAADTAVVSVAPTADQELLPQTTDIGAMPYCVDSGDGERLLAGDQLFTFLSHQGHTNGAFIALMTAGPRGVPIPKHFHEQHTESFLCLDGRMTMWANDEETTLTSGDFLHVPPGTIHSYRLDSPYTRFAGVLSPGLFEPFFRAMCEPWSGHTFPVTPGPVRFDRVMQRLHELDLKLVGPPGPPPARGPRPA
jgi:quercetin 2,3-dioxygenase